MTRAQFHSRVSSVAQFLKASSLKPGDRVLLTITPSLDMFCVAVAIFALGRQGREKREGREGYTHNA